ncbi:hypothetical protein FQZ97_778810 [compost metagenome]
MAAHVARLEHVGGVHLLGHLHAVQVRLAAAQLAAAAFVDAELGLQQLGLVVDEPEGAVAQRVAALLVGRERQDDVALGLEAFLLELPQHGDQRRGHGLVVDGAARREVAAGFLQLEGVGLPVFAAGLDHVDVGQQQQRLLAAVALEAQHQVPLLREGLEDLDVAGREARVDQPFFHGPRRDRVVAHRVGGVDLDQFLVDLAKALLLRGERRGLGLGAGDAGQGQREREHAASGGGQGRRRKRRTATGLHPHGLALSDGCCGEGQHSKRAPFSPAPERPRRQAHSRPWARACNGTSSARSSTTTATWASAGAWPASWRRRVNARGCGSTTRRH